MAIQMEQRPWTAIIPINELYYLALQEKLRLKEQTLSIIHLKSRKTQKEEQPTLLSSKPWERFTSNEILSLYINFDAEEPSHADFNLQKEATRNRERGLKAVFIDEVTLKIPYEIDVPEKTHYEVDFRLARVPKNSETLKAIRENVLSLKSKYKLYMDISKRDKTFYERVFQNPSCLEVKEIRKVAKPFGSLKNDLLNGQSKESQMFLYNLMHTTKNIAWDVYKRFDTRSGYILDGLVKSETIKERLGIEGN